MENILITGSSGFIGYHLTKRLLEDGNYKVIGIDNMNDYYDTELKQSRLKELSKYKNFEFYNLDIENKEDIELVFKNNKPKIVVNLAGRAGVRASNELKKAYIDTNIIGFYNILELCSNYNIEHLIYASSSSVYGDNKNVPYKEEYDTNEPVSIYAATKKCDEILAHVYSSINNLTTTGLRFFTVYGPFGRPDMAYFKYTKKLLNDEKVEVYNKGNLRRDFTYIDDIVEGITRVINNKPKTKYNIYNIGNENPKNLVDFINLLASELKEQGLLPNNFDINEKLDYVDMQKGDVYETYSDTSKFYNDFEYKPKVNLEDGIKEFVNWYTEYYKNNNDTLDDQSNSKKYILK